MNTNAKKVGKHELVQVDNPNCQQLIANYPHFSGITMNEKDRMPKVLINLILGASVYICMKTKPACFVGKDGRTGRREKKVWLDHKYRSATSHCGLSKQTKAITGGFAVLMFSA